MAPFGVVRCAHDLTNPNGRVCFFSFGPIEANGAVRAMNAQLLISLPDLAHSISAGLTPARDEGFVRIECQYLALRPHPCQPYSSDRAPLTEDRERLNHFREIQLDRLTQARPSWLRGQHARSDFKTKTAPSCHTNGGIATGAPTPRDRASAAATQRASKSMLPDDP
jgi:hypothetical protein